MTEENKYCLNSWLPIPKSHIKFQYPDICMKCIFKETCTKGTEK